MNVENNTPSLPNKKKILVITSAFPYESDSAGIFIKEQLKFIMEDCDRITVVSPLAYFPGFLLNSKRFKKLSGHSISPRNYSFENVNVFFPRYIPLPTSNFFLILRKYLSFLSVEKIIKKERIKFDLIHSHFIFPSGYVGAKLKNKYNKPLVITAHGGDIYSQPFINKKWLRSTQYILNSANKIITTSQRNYDIIVEKFAISKTKVKIIRNGFDDKIFFPMDLHVARDKLSLQKDCKIILSIGNLIPIKGHQYLVEAMKDIATKRKDIVCFIIGKGSQRDLQTVVEKLNLSSYVKLVGAKPHEELYLWINACDIFVLPSLDEGFPTVIPEALACGKPVIATSVGGIPEIIHDENIGLLVNKQDSKSLSHGICIALQKNWDTQKIVDYAKNYYTWRRISTDIINIYTNCIDHPH